jgi:hypothetical protein
VLDPWTAAGPLPCAVSFAAARGGELPAHPNLLGSLQSLCSSPRPRAGTGTLGNGRYGQLQPSAEHPTCCPPATLPCSGTCAGTCTCAPSHQAYCAGPIAILTRFVPFSSPWAYPSLALFLFFSLLPIASPSFLSTTAIFSCETACKRACHSFLVLLVKLSVIHFCELLLRISSNSHSLLLPVRLALHILSFYPLFPGFLVLPWTNER